MLTQISRKIVGFFLGIIATFRRLLCFLHVVRRRKNSGSLLPLVNNHSDVLVQGEVQTSLPSNDLEMEPWESWGSDPSGFAQSNPTQNERYIKNPHGNHVLRTKTASESEQEPEMDFFTDMQPEIKKSAKILIRKKEDNGRVNNFSNRLAMSGAPVPVMQDGELTNWDESENAWSSETLEDLSWEAESALKEKKRQERERRQVEQQRKKIEREKNMRNDSRLTAVKLS